MLSLSNFKVFNNIGKSLSSVAPKSAPKTKAPRPKVEHVHVDLGNLPQKPKRPPSAFNLFFAEQFDLDRSNDGTLLLKSAMPIYSKKWKDLPVEKKAEYDKKLLKDYEKYSQDKASYDSVMKKTITVEKMVDVINDYLEQTKKLAKANKPLRNPGPYAIYVQEQFKNSSTKMNLKELGEKWRSMSASEKEKYTDLAAEGKKTLKN
ncbi:Transcription factor A, mitochondrial [Halotydeus destructor]|nr:Transcription factor A, mitochondrial [Halotydeus destructor]